MKHNFSLVYHIFGKTLKNYQKLFYNLYSLIFRDETKPYSRYKPLYINFSKKMISGGFNN